MLPEIKPISRTRQALLDRLDRALSNIYHNATLHIPMSIDDPDGKFSEFISEEGSREIEYIEGGLGCSNEYWKKQTKLGFAHNERYFWLVTRITEFGELFQWGRGGRTVAPENLINSRGGSYFRIKDSSYFEGMSNLDLTDMIQVIEAFNTYIEKWCSSENMKALYEQFLEYQEENNLEVCPTCGK